MKFNVLGEEEMKKQISKFIEGECDFEVTQAIEKKSSKGNDMIELHLRCTDNNGKSVTVYDYITCVNMEWKIKLFCDSIGKPEYYTQGEIDAKWVEGMTGRAEVYLQEDKTGQFKPKYVVKNYLKDEQTQAQKELIAANDDIPF